MAPNDGAHSRNKSGELHTTKACYLHGKLVGVGRTAVYKKIGRNKGVKIFYSLEKGQMPGPKTMRRLFGMYAKLSKYKCCPKPFRIGKAKLNVVFDHRHIKATAPALYMEHIRSPKKAFKDYVHGRPYDFMALNQKSHPDHNAEGVRKFRKQLRKFYKKAGVPQRKDTIKMGNTMYCTKDKRWKCVDP
ncbi:MAG: hypothetical protein ACYS17_02685 [Planctomycetota bacterium]|jgi:hypothetical protein